MAALGCLLVGDTHDIDTESEVDKNNNNSPNSTSQIDTNSLATLGCLLVGDTCHTDTESNVDNINNSNNSKNSDVSILNDLFYFITK